MAIEWVEERETSTNGIRIGIDLTGTRSGSTVDWVFELWVWTKRASSGSSASYSRNWSFGSSSSSFSYSHTNNSSDWPTSNQTRIGRWTASSSLSPGQSRTVTASGGVSGLSGNMPSGTTSGSRSVTVSRPATTPSAPGRPTVSSITSSGVRVAWSAPSSTGGASITDYQVRIMQGGSTVLVANTGTTRSHTFSSGLDPRSSYEAIVRASNSAGWSGYSAGRAFTTSALGPNAPTSVSASRNSDTSHTVSWFRQASSSRPYERRRIQRRTFSASGWSGWSTRQTFTGTQTGTGTSSWTDTGTGANRAYQWRVVVDNDAGSATSSSTDTHWTTPWHPTGLSAQATGSGIRVWFTNNVQYGSHAHEVQHRADGGSWQPFATFPGSVDHHWTERTFLHSSPDLTVTHQYRIRSRTTSGPLLVSDWQQTNTVELASPPNAPRITGPNVPQAVGEQTTVTYVHAPTDGSEQQSRLIRWRRPGGSWSELLRNYTSSQTYTLGELATEPGIVELQVRTWGSHPDPSPWSPTHQIVMVDRPTVAINAPTQGQVVDTSTVLLSWGYAQGGDEEDQSPQVGWRWTLYAGGVEVQSRSGGGDRSTSTIANLADATTYTIRLEVQSADGLWSEPDEVTFAVDYLEPDAPTITAVSWDVASGSAVVEIEQPEWDQETTAEPSHHELWRSIGDGPWLLIADQVPLGTAITDPIPAIGDGTVNYYRAVTVSVLPSTADSETVALAVPSTGKGGTGGWVYLNAGPGMSEVCRIRANATRDDTEGVEGVLEYDSGRTRPTLQAGTAEALSWSISARIAPNTDGASTRGELVALQKLSEPVMYRDPIGARWVGYMGPVSSSWRSILGDVSWSMTQVDYVEGLATVEQAAEPGGGDDA